MARFGDVLPHCISQTPPRNYNPAFPPAEPGGRPYTVQAGESFFSIARKPEVGVDPADLLRFNFGTVDPKEVNYYLKHRLKCMRTTDDRKNYVFDPGQVIFIPPSGSVTGSVEDLTDLIEAMGFKGATLNKLVERVNTIRMVGGAACTVAGMFTGSTAVAAAGGVLAAAGTVLSPLAGMLKLGHMFGRPDRMLAQAARAYAMTAWVFRNPWIPPAEPAVEFYARSSGPAKGLRTTEQRLAELRKIWNENVASARNGMDQTFDQAFKKYSSLAAKESRTPVPRQRAAKDFRDVLKAGFGTSEQGFLNGLWSEVRRQSPEGDLYPSTIKADSRKYPNYN